MSFHKMSGMWNFYGSKFICDFGIMIYGKWNDAAIVILLFSENI